MVQISYDNVLRALNHNLNMRLICPTHQVADSIFFRMLEHFHIEKFTSYSKEQRFLRYGVTLPDPLTIHVMPISMITTHTMRGFDGIYMIHPSFSEMVLTIHQEKMLDNINHTNNTIRHRYNVRNEPRTT